MKHRLWIGISLALVAIVFISFTHPREMVSPGRLIPAHSALENNCFACHVPFQGASADRCISCHVLADIGLRTTRGTAIPQAARRPAFHQALANPDCVACHSDHPRPSLTKAGTLEFDHAVLKPTVLSNCQSCHTAPRDELHHGQASVCATCHRTARWKPATFDHNRYFVLDRDHSVACVTCHASGNYKQYTCFGCHQHQEAGIIAEHREEGITDIRHCVRCHRSANGEAEGERRIGTGDD